jgi:hypothetical protein
LPDKGVKGEKKGQPIEWVMGEDGVIEPRKVEPVRRSLSIDKAKADEDDATIILSDPAKKASKAEPVELVKVRGIDGVVRYQKASDFANLPIKEKVEAEKTDVPAKAKEEPTKEEVTREKELEKLKAELADLNKEEAKPGVEAGKGDAKQAELDKVKRVEEIKAKMAEIKAARDTAVYEELRAELAKAAQPKAIH